jgi:hypothetical protein
MDLWLAFGALCIAAGCVVAVLRLREALQGWRLRRTQAQQAPPPPPAMPERPRPTRPPISLESQIESLAAAGCPLAPGVGIDDLLHSFPREEYEADPYVLLLITYGWEAEKEPYGRHYSTIATAIDMECIEGTGSYVALAEALVAVTGRQGLLTHATDAIDFGPERAAFAYTIGSQSRTLHPVVNNDWADPAVLTALMTDIETAVGDGRRFYGVENGQASTWFFIQPEVADRLDALRGEPIMDR